MSQLCEFIQEGFGPCSERIVAARRIAVCGPLVEFTGTIVYGVQADGPDRRGLMHVSQKQRDVGRPTPKLLPEAIPKIPRAVYASERPQVWQKLEAVGEYCPQAGQSIGAAGSTCCRGVCISTTVG